MTTDEPSDASVPAICLLGPTASGKTEIAVCLARDFDCAIISVDSAQVYRGMDIGTAKPGPGVLAQAPHQLIDIRDPWESYSAGDFARDAALAMHEISDAGQLPLLVGGTMLYFKVLQEGIADLPGPDAEIRADIEARAARDGWERLHAELAELDPETAARLHPTDRQRIQRALEICLVTGEPAADLQKINLPRIRGEYLNIGLLPERRDVLHERIADRLQQMRKAGFLEEVRALSQLPRLSREAPAMRAVGYRQLWRCIAGECSESEAFDKALVASRRLAKRQMTWLRSWPDLHRVDCTGDRPYEAVRVVVERWLESRATPRGNS
jgi:tRNA dimethylallyltransferase